MTGAASTIICRHAGSTRTATASACPRCSSSPWARRDLPIDHTEYSFDSFLKLIEDRFLQGERLDGINDYLGSNPWPDPRPTVREEVPTLGDLRFAFDFGQVPRAPLILDPNPG
jgi:hypothetical protein